MSNPSVATPLMPAAFIGHGSPMNALEHNRWTEAWHDFGRSIPTPRAIVAVSAHWYGRGTAVTAMPTPRTIHDFGGFPDQLFAVRYPAPGSPEVAAEVAEVVQPTRVAQDRSWGLDHGTWSVLVHMFPKADVPVVQLSIDAGASVDEHVAIGAALAPLRERGVLVLASGSVVHNLRMLRFDAPTGGFDWALEFDDAVREQMTAADPAALGRLTAHRHYRLASPTPDHFVPLAYLAGLASAAGQRADVLTDGPTMGSLTMTAYSLAGAAA